MKSFKKFVLENIELEEAKKPKPGHNAMVLAKNIEKVLKPIKKEEVEGLDEISAGLVNRYAKKATKSKNDAIDTMDTANKYMSGKKAQKYGPAKNTLDKRMSGLDTAWKKTRGGAKIAATEESELDEAYDTDYVRRAIPALKNGIAFHKDTMEIHDKKSTKGSPAYVRAHSAAAAAHKEAAEKHKVAHAQLSNGTKDVAYYINPARELGAHAEKLSVKANALKEEVEQIDEISKELLRKYKKVAKDDEQAQHDAGLNASIKQDDKRINDKNWYNLQNKVDNHERSYFNRRRGQALATKKIGDRAKVNATEEVELDEETMPGNVALRLVDRHHAAAFHHKKNGNMKGYAAHFKVANAIEDSVIRAGRDMPIRSKRLEAASDKVFKEHPHRVIKSEEVEITEATAPKFKKGDKVHYETSRDSKDNKGVVHSHDGDQVTIIGKDWLGGPQKITVHQGFVRKQ
jgi:hypothetical protein